MRRTLSLVAFLVTALVVGAGCAKGPSTNKSGEPAKTGAEKKPTDASPQAINLGPGDTTAYTIDSPRRPLWTLRWESARLTGVAQKQVIGEVTPASGEILRVNEPSIPFSADRGRGDQVQKKLDLDGNVKLSSQSPKVTLFCQSLRYDASAKIVIAKGNVRVESVSGTLSTDQELWATPDLRIVGTKDEFLQSRSGLP